MLTQNDQLMNQTRIDKAVAAPAPPWVQDLRRRGIERFHEVGLPTTKNEEWRHTNVAAIGRIPFKPAKANDDASVRDVYRFSFQHAASCELVFVNGIYSPGLSNLRHLPRGVRVSSLAAILGSTASADDGVLEQHLGKQADIARNPFVAWNSGFLHDGAVIRIDNGTVVEKPIHLLFLSFPIADEPAVAHPRVLIIAGDNADAQVVETYSGIGSGAYLTNAVSEVIVGDNSRIDHCRLQHETPEAFHISTTQATVGRASTFITQSATLGAQLTRNDLNVVLAGDGAEATMNGLVIANGKQHVDNHTLLDHAAPNCPSHELYKHVLGGSATVVFRGKILVRPGAQKTDSKQTSRSLLISDDADMNSQPALEIYADDVKCTHGSTTGPVDEEMMFYIRSRGVSQPAARALLTYAFAADITRRIQVDPVRTYLENFMAAQHDLPQDLRITDLGRHDEKHR